ncbi:hypothetical protein AKJ37_05770, partial [candidate division MSBL1 archaeon SCGC-AAA259I09]
QTGIETGSPRLIEKYMSGKALPSSPEEWPEIVRQSLGILEENGWVPACTTINGLPGEEPDDVVRTLELIDEIKDYKALIVPLNFVFMEGSHLSEEKSFTAEDMLPEHWQVIGECLEHDAQVSREMKDSIQMEGSIKGRLLDWLTDYLIGNGEKYAQEMKEGSPPADYDEVSQHTFPECLERREVKNF